jgi:hypothetical protein
LRETWLSLFKRRFLAVFSPWELAQVNKKS